MQPPLIDQKFFDIGRCIYCGQADDTLTNEHVIPYALGGILVLRNASCMDCQKITSSFERRVLRDTFLPARTKMQLPTGHKRNRPEALGIGVERNGQKDELMVPVHKHPTTLFLPRFKRPACWDNREYTKGIDIVGMYTYQVDLPSLQQFAAEAGVEKVIYTVTFDSYRGGLSFARLLAKIAYGFAVANYGNALIDNNYLTSAILGKSDDTGKWIGCMGESPARPNHSHYIELHEIRNNIWAKLNLFAKFEDRVPEYAICIAPIP